MQQNANLSYKYTNYDTTLYDNILMLILRYCSKPHACKASKRTFSIWNKIPNIEYLNGYMSNTMEIQQKCFNKINTIQSMQTSRGQHSKSSLLISLFFFYTHRRLYFRLSFSWSSRRSFSFFSISVASSTFSVNTAKGEEQSLNVFSCSTSESTRQLTMSIVFLIREQKLWWNFIGNY